MNPWRAWARSPTTVKLRDGQRAQQHLPLGVGQFLGLVDDDVRERAGELVRVDARQGGLVDQACSAKSWPRSIDITISSLSSDAMRSSTTSAICACWRRDRGLPPALAPCGLRVADPLSRRIQERQVGDGPRSRILTLERLDLVGREPRRAQPQVGGHRPQVADDCPPGRAAATPWRRCWSVARSAAGRDAAGAAAPPHRRTGRSGCREAPPRPGRAPRCAGCPHPPSRTPPPTRRR